MTDPHVIPSAAKDPASIANATENVTAVWFGVSAIARFDLHEGAQLQQFHVYILANRSHTIYTGVTNDLERRVYEHKTKAIDGFTAKYNIGRLVYYETFGSINDAIAREKQIKGWLRAKKIARIESRNRYWRDLAADWFPNLSTGQGQRAERQDARPHAS